MTGQDEAEEKKAAREKEEEKKTKAKEKKRGKKQHKNKPTSKKYKFYKIENNQLTKARHCPRCGPGIFLAKSKSGDRYYCGKCHYTEFIGKESKEQEKEENKEKETTKE